MFWVQETGGPSGVEEDSLDEELEKNKEARAAGMRSDNPELQERAAYRGSGEAECKSCGYVYRPEQGDLTYPVSKGIQFQACLPYHFGK